MKSQVHRTTILSLSHEGRGIAEINGKKIFISTVLPTETVECTVKHQRRRRFANAQLNKIISPSPSRIPAKCAHFERCGGCSLQHMSSRDQIQHKQNVFLEQLWHFGKVRPNNLCPPIKGPVWGYRRKARLSVRYRRAKEDTLVGFRERDYPRFITEMDTCSVLHPSVGEKIHVLRECIHSLEGRHDIAQIEIAVGDLNTALIVRHLKPLSPSDQTQLQAFASTHHLLIYTQSSDIASIKPLDPNTEADALYYSLPDYDLKLFFKPSDFLQVNQAINQKLIKQALAWLDLQAEDYVLDLFCGLGNFSLPLAKHAAHVVGIEGDTEMVQRAQDNARYNKIDHTLFLCANLEKCDLTSLSFPKPIDKVLLDPPRSGAAALLPSLAKLAPKRIVYVSCNPATLARDLHQFVHEYGYQLSQAGIIDMFPHTQHVEAMALLIRGDDG